jgi:hypothetical protein
MNSSTAPKTNESLQIATTIIQQIKATDCFSLMAWGARDYVALNEGEQSEIGFILGGVQFTVSGAKVKGKVLVYLMGDDTYTVRVGKIRKCEWKDIKIVEGVYCDTLMSVIDNIIEK